MLNPIIRTDFGLMTYCFYLVPGIFLKNPVLKAILFYLIVDFIGLKKE